MCVSRMPYTIDYRYANGKKKTAGELRGDIGTIR